MYVFISIAVDSYAVEDIILTWLNPDALQIDGKLQIPQYTLVAWQQKQDLNKYSTGNYSNPKGNEASFYFFHFFFILLCPVSYYGYVTQLFDLLCNRWIFEYCQLQNCSLHFASFWKISRVNFHSRAPRAPSEAQCIAKKIWLSRLPTPARTYTTCKTISSVT